MISDERIERALLFLRDSSLEHAQATGAIVFLEYKIKRIKATAFLEAEGTIAERTARAETHAEVKRAVEEYRDVVVTERLLRDKRVAAELTIEVWRSQQANQRAVNV